MNRKKLRHIKTTKNSFKIPKGYFETVEDAVMTKIAVKKFSEKEGYTSPKGYFDSLEDSILKKIHEQKANQSAVPLSKKTGFAMPENYLNTVEDKVTTKVHEESKKVKVINLKTVILKRIIPFVAAASVLLLIVVNYNSKTSSFETLASTDIEQWIENDLITLDTYEIADVYNDTELESSSLFTENEDEVLNYLDGTDIESLLIEN